MATKKKEHITRLELKRIGVHCVNFNLRKATRIVTRIFDECLEPLGITSSQFSILTAIGVYKDLTVTALADILAMERTTLTRNLKLLEKNNLIEYSQDTDARKKLVDLTDHGWDIMTQAAPLRKVAQEQMVELIGEGNWKQSRHTLSKLINQL